MARFVRPTHKQGRRTHRTVNSKRQFVGGVPSSVRKTSGTGSRTASGRRAGRGRSVPQEAPTLRPMRGRGASARAYSRGGATRGKMRTRPTLSGRPGVVRKRRGGMCRSCQ